MHIMHFLEPLKSLVVLAVVVGLVAEWGLNQFLTPQQNISLISICMIARPHLSVDNTMDTWLGH